MIHKASERSAPIYGENGADFTRSRAAVLALPARSFVIDGELIAGMPAASLISAALLFAKHQAPPLCVYAFDLLKLRGRYIRNDPLVQWCGRLKSLQQPPDPFQRKLQRFRRTDGCVRALGL